MKAHTTRENKEPFHSWILIISLSTCFLFISDALSNENRIANIGTNTIKNLSILSILLRQSYFEPFPCDPVSSRDISIDQKQPHRTVNLIVVPDEYFERLFTTLWFDHYVSPVGASMHLHLQFTFLLAGRNLYVTKQIIHTHTYN